MKTVNRTCVTIAPQPWSGSREARAGSSAQTPKADSPQVRGLRQLQCRRKGSDRNNVPAGGYFLVSGCWAVCDGWAAGSAATPSRPLRSSRMLLPMLAPSCGSLFGPNTNRAMTRTSSRCMGWKSCPNMAVPPCSRGAAGVSCVQVQGRACAGSRHSPVGASVRVSVRKQGPTGTILSQSVRAGSPSGQAPRTVQPLQGTVAPVNAHLEANRTPRRTPQRAWPAPRVWIHAGRALTRGAWFPGWPASHPRPRARSCSASRRSAPARAYPAPRPRGGRSVSGLRMS